VLLKVSKARRRRAAGDSFGSQRLTLKSEFLPFSVKRPELYASAFLAALAAAACAMAYRMGLGDIHNPGPGFMPLATAALLGLMALGELGRDLIVAIRRGAEPAVFAPRGFGTALVVIGALAGFGMAIETLGFSVSAALMLTVLFVVARMRLWVAVLAAVLIAVIARVIFWALGVPFPEGPLGF
jgi:putative tricarboxylic transport membrane protein